MADTAARGMAKRLFKLGGNKVHLPSHVITFLRRDDYPAHWAHFQVPLSFTKFDLRDYLWNLYRVQTTSVRSAVQQHRVERRNGGRGALFRPPATKYMTAELTRPFVWPEVPEDLEPWNKTLWDAREKGSAQMRDQQRLYQEKGRLVYHSKEPMTLDRRSLRDQAQAYLDGKIKWETDGKLDEKWAPTSTGTETETAKKDSP